PLSGGLVFDLTRSELRFNDRGKLTNDTPVPVKWQVDGERRMVRLRQGGEEVPPVGLRGGDGGGKAGAALLAPEQPHGAPAIRSTERTAARTLIMLCNAEDGKPFRLLVSHLQDVRELAFSLTRPLLASVAEDQTVCVWSLADLDTAIGAVEGLSVVDAEKDG